MLTPLADARFQQLSAEHIVVLGLTAACAGLCVLVARRRPPARVVLSRSLALVILGAAVAEHLAFAVRGTWMLERNLPLHLTDAVTIVSIIALWSARPLLVELVYFWAPAPRCRPSSRPISAAVSRASSS